MKILTITNIEIKIKEAKILISDSIERFISFLSLLDLVKFIYSFFNKLLLELFSYHRIKSKNI